MRKTKSPRVSLPEIQEEENRRLARMLHDNVGQNIAALHMSLSLVAESKQALEPLKRQALEDGIALALTCGREIRSLSYDLYPPLLDDFGLLVGLRAYFGDYSKRTGTKLELLLPLRLSRLPREIEIGVFRIAQEAVISIHQLSQGSTTLRVQRRTGSLHLELIHQGNLEASRLELTRIRERARLLGSELVVESTPDSLKVRVVLPAQKP